jgi:trehalose synthase
MTPSMLLARNRNGRFAAVKEIDVRALPLERFSPIVGARRAAAMRAVATRARKLLAGRAVWHVNSTGAGGGVAEMLQTLLGYARGAGMDTHWLVIEGDPEFFAITKRVHNGLHGASGDSGSLGNREQEHYSTVLARNAAALRARIRPGDIVILHDPQTAGLVGPMRATGAIVIWRCHIGHDATDPVVERAWEFIRPHLREAHAYVFTRAAYVPPWLRGGPVYCIPPSIDVFSTKNHFMDARTAHAILATVGLLDERSRNGGLPVFQRNDGSIARVQRRPRIVHSGALPSHTNRLIVQVSRWDRLKDMLGRSRGCG